MLLPRAAVAQWLPPGLTPAGSLGVTRGLVTFQRLGRPEEMAPYSEAQFAVRVKDSRGRQAWHVLEMPVDSAENLQRGKVIFGYPKELSQLKVGARTGTASTPDGTPLFSIRMGPALPFGIARHVDNEAVQVLNGELVRLDSWAEGKMVPGLASVELSPELRRRYPGLPARPLVLFGGRLEHGELSLSLPQKT
ncbi:MAG: acetoacetate decarboxylase family protein [Archangiaceae bacterium]|nr:acetoacetate decarboxylase family protein [Archangiaceae bacterium]